MPSQFEAQRGRARWPMWAGLGGLVLVAIGSVVQGIHNAVLRSQDFQWSGVRMLFARLDPWAEYLRGDPNHLIHLSQIPNYLPVLYVLISPLGLLPLVPAELAWAGLNVLFAAGSGILAARFYGLHRLAGVAVACLLLASTPARQTIGNGQQGLLVLFLWCVSLLVPRMTARASMGAGLAYFKFNFAPPMFLYLLLRGGMRAVLYSAVPSGLAALILWLWLTHGSNVHELLAVLTGPFAVSRTGYFPSGGDPNLMDVLQVPLLPSFVPGTLLPSVVIVPPWVTVLTLSIALAACSAILYVAMRRTPNSSIQWQLALLATASFGLFKHHAYDAVVLLLPLCHALRLWRHTRAKIVIGAVAYVWYLERLLEQIKIIWRFLFLVEFAVLMLLLTMTYQLREAESELHPAWDVEGNPHDPERAFTERAADGK